ncbi:restriction endonuclease subunit S [Campylobacter sp. RM12327]|uniref:restriction endonuclease subunit S n=1 Tax=Campylobacter sputorum TaxID=206 RepID=UPI0018968669|nr:restriction endonuclease subunit S [Campylobacter sp. RM12327]MBF6669997.1 restriction endonuclease subunit S [Campylobacter sp. RM12327]
MKQDYKKTSLGIIPNEWKIYELNDIIEISKNKFNPLNNNTQRCIELEHVEQDTGFLLGYTNSTLQKSIKNSFKKGQILYGKLRPYLCKFYKAEFDGVCSSEIWVFQGKKVINDFLFYLIQSYKFKYIANISVGTKMPRADWNYMSEIPFFIPPPKEQIKIAEILSEFDTAINLMSNLISQKTKFKKALMQNLLTAKIRLPEFKDKWQEVKLGEIGEFKTSSVDKIIKNNERIVSLINYMDVYKNTHIDINLKLSKTSATKQEIEKFCVKKGDVLFTPSSETPDDIGHSAVICDNFNYTLYSYHLVRFRSFINFDNIFLGYVFNNEKILKQFSKLSQGITRYTLSIKDFQNIKIKLPNLDEQKKIAEILSSVDDEINLLNLKLKNLKDLKKGVMQNLLTGKVRVK